MKKVLLSTLTAMTMMTTSTSLANAQPVNEDANPFMQAYTAPHAGVPFDKIQTADFEGAILEGIKQQNAEIEAILNNPGQATFLNTIVPLERSGSLLYNASIAMGNMEGALGDEDIMQMVAKMTPILNQHETSIMLNEALWTRIKEAYEKDIDNAALTAEDRMLLKETYLNFANSGAKLQGKDRERYRELSAELGDLVMRFSQNLSYDMKNPIRRMWLKRDQLAGLPENIIDAARFDAQETLKSEGKEDNPELYLFTVFFPSYGPFMKYADNRDLRKQMYELYNTRNVGGKYDNTQILKDIANIRLEIANLMGYPTWADYKLTRTMAKKPQNVYNLLNQLRDAYYPAMQQEIAEIRDYARKQLNDENFNIEAWDYSYWSDKLKNDKYAFNDEDMRPYFEIDNTIKGVFSLATKLYGYKFKENKQIPTYHKDAKAFEVTDRKGDFVGVLYTDFFSRPGKSPGAWMTEYRGEYIDDNGVKQCPLISIVMNFSKPTGTEPALLTPYEVETFLHEFGHALQGLSANTKYQSLAGTNVSRDFVELFSQFNENYLTEKDYLDSFAKHYKTGKKMPKALIDKFIKSSQYGAAYACVRQLTFGFLDMGYYTITNPLRATLDIEAFERKATEPVKIFDAVPGTMMSPAFGHIFSGGYSSGYYGYKWSEVLDADAFSKFKETGNIFDRKTADAYMKMMSSGGTVDSDKLYEEFRGRSANVDALMKRDGIQK